MGPFDRLGLEERTVHNEVHATRLVVARAWPAWVTLATSNT